MNGLVSLDFIRNNEFSYSKVLKELNAGQVLRTVSTRMQYDLLDDRGWLKALAPALVDSIVP